MNLTKENYFDFGDAKRIVVSNSMLSYINPDEGGSPTRLRNYILGNIEKKDSISLYRGKLFHKYLELPEAFVIAPEEKPSDAVCNIIDALKQKIQLTGQSFSPQLELYQQEIVTLAREMKFGASNWSSETIIKKIREKGDGYANFLYRADGSFIVDAKTEVILRSIVSNFEGNEYLRNLFIEHDEYVNKEIPILFEVDGVECKALIDHLIIDHTLKIALIRDVKTTSTPVSMYKGFKVLYPDNQYRLVQGSFQQYRVYRQLGFYREAVKQHIQKLGYNSDEYMISASIVACETIEPYEVREYDVTQQELKIGYEEAKYCIKKIKEQTKEIAGETESQYEY